MAACYMLNIVDSYECITDFVEIFQYYDGRLNKIQYMAHGNIPMFSRYPWKNLTDGMGIFPHHGTQTGKTMNLKG